MRATVRSAAPAAVAVGERCTACGACLATCPERALFRAPRRPAVRADRCTGCLACLEVCPADAITHPAEPEAMRCRFGTSLPPVRGGQPR